MRISPDVRLASALIGCTWVLSGLLYMLPYHLFQGGLGTFVVMSVINVCLAGAVLSAGLYWAARRLRGRRPVFRALAMIGGVLASSSLLAFYDAMSSATLSTALEFGGPLPPLALRATNNFVALVWQFALLAAAFTVMEATNLARVREGELAAARELASRAEAAATAARLAALRYQLNPHFLFNTLNAISALIITRAYDDADTMLGKLSEFLRATLSSDPEDRVPLQDELATLQHYLEIESVRFGDRLEVAFSCDADLGAALVPSFILQPLVENAIKYAVAPSPERVTIRVETLRDDHELLLVVEDDGDPHHAQGVQGGTGVGLENLRQRLQVLHGDQAGVRTEQRACGFRASIRLPLELADLRFPKVA